MILQKQYLLLLRTVLFILLSFDSFLLQAQVRGVVQNTEGETIAGANIVWAGTNKGTVSDDKGDFLLERVLGKTEIVT